MCGTPPPTPGENRICIGCGWRRPKDQFTDQQWRDSLGECKECEALGASPGPPTGEWNVGMNQDCGEQMVLSAAERLDPTGELRNMLVRRLREAYTGKTVKDVQLDLLTFLGPVFQNSIVTHFGKNKEELSEGLKNTLKEKELYFFRTGENKSAGHYQILYYEDGWHMYSSPALGVQKISRSDGKLTEEGEGLLKPNSNWGLGDKEAVYVFTPAREEMLLPLMNYIIDCRVLGEEAAMEKNIYFRL